MPASRLFWSFLEGDWRLNISQDAEVLANLRSTQQIIPVIRWFLIATAMSITNYRAGDIDNTTLAINNVAIWGLTIYNAFLHARSFVGRPLGVTPVLAASILDILVITALIGVTSEPFKNSFFIFYYPAVFGFGMVFPPVHVVIFTLATAVSYSLVSIFIGPGIFVSKVIESGVEIHSSGDEKILISRLMVMFALAAGASFFWRIERVRRAASVQAQLDILQTGLSDNQTAADTRSASVEQE